MIAFRAAQRETFALAGRYYTCANIFRQENQRIFSNHWLCVGRSEQISDAGDYFLTQVGEESLIILRDLAGIARAFFNVCRHRGTRLCNQLQGHLIDQIQCPYHAWTYSLEGELQATHSLGQDGFTAKDYPLYACALHEWEGFLWINLATNPAPFAQTFAPLLNRFTPWRMASLRSIHQAEYTVNANWKLIFQHYSESYHCPTRHPSLHRFPVRSGKNDLREGAFLGGYQPYDRHTQDSPLNSLGDSLPSVRGENRDRIYHYLLFPTMLLSLHPDYVVTYRITPQGTNQTQIVCQWLADPATVISFNEEGSQVDRWDLINRQAWRVCELAQQNIRDAVPSPYDCQDGLLPAFDREYLRVMGG